MKSRVRELYENYLGALEPWQIKLAIGRLRHFRVPMDVWDDMMQELAILITRFRFDAEKAHSATEETILCRRIDNRIRMVARSERRRRKRLEHLAVLRHRIEDESQPGDRMFRHEGRAVLAGAIRELEPELQEVCIRLMCGQSIYQISQETECAWATVVRQVRDIRELFIERGIDPWQA